MGMCNRIKTERVLYDQRVFLSDTETGVPLQLPPDVTLVNAANPLIQVTLMECDVNFDTTPPTLTVTPYFIVSFTGVLSNGEVRQFDFSFPGSPTSIPLVKLDRTVLTPDEIMRAFCQVFSVETTGTPTLRFTGVTFDIAFGLGVLIKIVVFDQIFVAACPPANTLTLSGGQIIIIGPIDDAR